MISKLVAVERNGAFLQTGISVLEIEDCAGCAVCNGTRASGALWRACLALLVADNGAAGWTLSNAGAGQHEVVRLTCGAGSNRGAYEAIVDASFAAVARAVVAISGTGIYACVAQQILASYASAAQIGRSGASGTW